MKIILSDERKISDGIYDVTDIPFIDIGSVGRRVNEKYNEDTDQYELIVNIKEEEIEKFIEKYPDFVIASAYATEYYILLAYKPKKFEGTKLGHGFNYGSTNMLIDCPRSVLILAEDD